jgi:hypothetical protein
VDFRKSLFRVVPEKLSRARKELFSALQCRSVLVQPVIPQAVKMFLGFRVHAADYSGARRTVPDTCSSRRVYESNVTVVFRPPIPPLARGEEQYDEKKQQISNANDTSYSAESTRCILSSTIFQERLA